MKRYDIYTVCKLILDRQKQLKEICFNHLIKVDDDDDDDDDDYDDTEGNRINNYYYISIQSTNLFNKQTIFIFVVSIFEEKYLKKKQYIILQN